eukprot:scaffold48_cov311-Pinguiococcus_pyrenoidosus.AAC.78
MDGHEHDLERRHGCFGLPVPSALLSTMIHSSARSLGPAQVKESDPARFLLVDSFTACAQHACSAQANGPFHLLRFRFLPDIASQPSSRAKGSCSTVKDSSRLRKKCSSRSLYLHVWQTST